MRIQILRLVQEHPDRLAVAGIAAALALRLIFFSDFSSLPTEDAAILMRYSGNLAAGAGIVWNPAGPHVDGATDFLFMLLLAGLNRLGVDLGAAVLAVGVIAHILTVFLLYFTLRRVLDIPAWMALISPLYAAVGPGLRYTEAYFGTTFFALAACLLLSLAWRITRPCPPAGLDLAFALTSLTLGLIRPEGVLLSALVLLAVVVRVGWKGARRTVLAWLLVFSILGGAYFAWRWAYFGYPLPNPYYKKGGGALHPLGLASSALNVLRFALPFVWIHLGAVYLSLVEARRRPAQPRSSALAGDTLFVLIPILGFTGVWVLLSDEMNFLGRFQYPVLILVLLSWPPLLTGLLRRWPYPFSAAWSAPPKPLLPLLAVVWIAGTLVYPFSSYLLPARTDDRGLRDMGLYLRSFKDRGYVLAVSEAGLLPFYSEWQVIDTWGLNDPWIAHHGQVTPAYLDHYRPEIIMYNSSRASTQEPAARPWETMVEVLDTYARDRGYVLAAVFRSEEAHQWHSYWVRQDFPEAAEITAHIRDFDYLWNGLQSPNHAPQP